MLSGEPGSQPWHGLVHPHWVDLEWTVPSASLVTPEGDQGHVSVCAVPMLRRPGHRGAIQGDPVGEPMKAQNLKGVKSMTFYRNQ